MKNNKFKINIGIIIIGIITGIYFPIYRHITKEFSIFNLIFSTFLLFLWWLFCKGKE